MSDNPVQPNMPVQKDQKMAEQEVADNKTVINPIYSGPQTQSSTQPVATPQPPQPAKVENVRTQPSVPPPAKKGIPIILLVIPVLLILVGLAYYFFKDKLPMKNQTNQGEITWWGLWEEDSAVSSLISEYEAGNPKVKINYVKQSKEDYRERLTNALAKGTGPDVFRFHNTWVPMFKNSLDYMPASVMSAAEFVQSYYPVASADLASGTGIVGVPLEYDGLSMYVNEDIFNKAGKIIPATWDELRQTAKELTIKDDSGNITQAGVAMGETSNVDHWQDIIALMMLQNGVNLANPTGPLAESALMYYTIFSTNDGVWDKTLPPSTIAFSSGKLAMYFGPSWEAFEIKQQNPSLQFKVVPVPQLPKTNDSERDIAYASYWVEGVNTDSKNKAAAWDFLKFLTSKESLQKLYQAEAQTRQFGEPYPRVDMADLLLPEPVVGAFIAQAPDAQSWYLVSRTFDGPTGINSQIGKYFEDAINAVNNGQSATNALSTVASGVTQVLSQYGLTTTR